MQRKKTTYEKKGLVRQLADSIFAPGGKDRFEESKRWRPRKSLFEKLEGPEQEEDFDIDIAIDRVFSVESETTDYRHGSYFEKKKVAIKMAKAGRTQHARNISSITIKPSARDLVNARTSFITKETQRKRKNEEPVMDGMSPSDPFGLRFVQENSPNTKSDVSVDSSKQTASTGQSAFHTITSDPTHLFSKESMRLTSTNLERLASSAKTEIHEGMTSSGIENINPRSEFHQFSIDEDKASTVVESSVGIHGEIAPSELGIDGKSTLDIDRAFGETGNSQNHNVTESEIKMEAEVASSDIFFPAFEDTDKTWGCASPKFIPNSHERCESKETHRNTNFPFIPSSQMRSSQSLVYSESSCGAPKAETLQHAFENLVDSKALYRSPLSSLQNCGRSMSSTKPDPAEGWAKFSKNSVEEKPDPNGMSANIVATLGGLDEDYSNDFENTWAQKQQSKRPFWRQRVIPEEEPVNEEDNKPEVRYEYGYQVKLSKEVGHTIGIRRFSSQEESIAQISKESSSLGSATSLYGQGMRRSSCSNSEYLSSGNNVRRDSSSESSFTKPLGLPSNAIMASMLFRRHHIVDTEVVDAKLKEREQAFKGDRNRGDIPETVQAVDGVSLVSSFSEDTAAQLDRWRKPTRDLLDHFAQSRRTNTNFKARIQKQRAQATDLFEA